jgi:hypothetical protein
VRSRSRAKSSQARSMHQSVPLICLCCSSSLLPIVFSAGASVGGDDSPTTRLSKTLAWRPLCVMVASFENTFARLRANSTCISLARSCVVADPRVAGYWVFKSDACAVRFSQHSSRIYPASCVGLACRALCRMLPMSQCVASRI